MVDIVCISARASLAAVKRRLQQELAFLEADGAEILIESGRSRFFNMLLCQIDYGKTVYTEQQRQQLGRQSIANALTDTLLDDWRKIILLQLLCRSFRCFSETEQEQIVALADQRWGEMQGPHQALYRKARKSRVREILSSYLLEENEVNLDGFVYFRLRNYWEELEDALYLALDYWLTEQEQQEFLHLLQQLAQAMEPRYDVIHVLLPAAREFIIFDQDGNELRSCELSLSFKDDTEFDDILISALFTLSPRQVVLHTPSALICPRAMRIVTTIFEQRVEICPACDFCLQQRKLWQN